MNGIQPNFGTLPHLLAGKSRATESWWTNQPRELFTARAEAERARMATSRIGQWITANRIVDLEYQ